MPCLTTVTAQSESQEKEIVGEAVTSNRQCRQDEELDLLSGLDCIHQLTWEAVRYERNNVKRKKNKIVAEYLLDVIPQK